MVWNFKRSLMLLTSAMLLLAGSSMLIMQIRNAFFEYGKFRPTNSIKISVKQVQQQSSDLQGAFLADSVDGYTLQWEGKDAFSLLLAHYIDSDSQQRRAVLFSTDKQKNGALPSPTALRQTIWQEAAKAIRANTPQNATMLSWWDDGQRIHFLSGHNAWVSKPAEETFISPVWRSLQDNLIPASASEKERLSKVARWLTMDSEEALAEIREFFGSNGPVYLLVTHDLLLRIGEMVDYGAKPLSFVSKTVPAQDNLHGDIARIKQWAFEEGDGNYLVQKVGYNYRVWATSTQSGSAKNALLVRLLPFVESLKNLPQGVHLVYQSNWGGYLSIYRLD